MSDEDAIRRRRDIQEALRRLDNTPLANGTRHLLETLGYFSDKTADLGNTPENFLANVEQSADHHAPLDRKKLMADKWLSCAFLFQLSNDEIPSLAIGQLPLGTDGEMARQQIESFVFVAIELEDEAWSRTQLATISRELNRRFPMPCILLFRHSEYFSLAVMDRRPNRRDPLRDVIDSRITLIKDVRIASPHRAHVDILARLTFEELDQRRRPTNFRELYNAWLEVLSTQALNRRFYQELAWWYFWAVKQVEFPRGGGADTEKRNAVAVIRLLTRLIFVWFIKEKGLVPEALFEREPLSRLLKVDPASDGEASNFYLAILQNLFFATLNVEMGEVRKWAQSGQRMKGDRLIQSVYRHKELFAQPDEALEIFRQVPFLNGGLFECLDRELTPQDLQRDPDLEKLANREGKGLVLRVDGFSRRGDAQPTVPNRIFFSGAEDVDLNQELGTRNKRYPVHGLLDIFARYKFTVDENTPIEEEVALDPELLGKVFENLLASYNEDTRSTARKQSGSFYTPREVVDYMVDEALIAYFQRHLASGNIPSHEREGWGGGIREPDDDTYLAAEGDGLETRLRALLSYGGEENPFDEGQTEQLIAAIEAVKILDPACGSGAFPMGILNKLVHSLRKLDPGNRRWMAQNRAPLERQLTEAARIPDAELRDSREQEAETALARFDEVFSQRHHADYTRKLYLIEKCIFGVDIQPIAVQIAKLRFFISLIVSQVTDPQGVNAGVTPLPNMETKIVAADTLTPIERPAQMGLRDPAIDDKERELARASARYFAARTVVTKRKYRELIFTLRDELAQLLETDAFLPAGAARQLVHWNPFDQNSAADFFDPEWMFQLSEGFDISIGNPPYVRQEQIRDIKDRLKENFECYTGTADLYVYFYERAIQLLKPEGVFSFITSNKWYRAKYGEKLRDWMSRNTLLRKIIDFGDEPIFTAIAYPTIVIATRRKMAVKQAAKGDQVRALNWVSEGAVEDFPVVFEQESFLVPQSELSTAGWQLEPPVKRRLLERMRAVGVPLGEYVGGRFYRGVLTGFNDAFVIDGATRERLIAEDPRSAEIIKPFLRGRDVKRWRVEPQDLWLIFVPWHFPLHNDISLKGASKQAEKEFKKQYPAIFNHLSQHKTSLEARNKSETGLRYEWYALQRWAANYWHEFDHPKIIYPDIYLHQSFAWDTKSYYSSNTCYFIPTNERWMTGLLNSIVIEWFYEQTANRIQNGYLRAFSDYMKNVPIPNSNANEKAILDACVVAILDSAGSHFEQLINGLVFELFFPDDLHAADIHLFDTCEQAGLARLASLEGKKLTTATAELADKIFSNDHPIYAMLFDLQALDVVRIIENWE